MNLARNTAITLNGGLSVYVPAACMFSSGGSGGSCLVENNGAGLSLSFQRRRTGLAATGQAPQLHH